MTTGMDNNGDAIHPDKIVIRESILRDNFDWKFIAEWHADPDESFKQDAQRWVDSYVNHNSESLRKRVNDNTR